MVDLLAICAHPDDLEVCAGGIFAKAVQEGLRTALIILTKGEAGGYADAETRVREAEAAAKILGITYLKILDFPDAGLWYHESAVQSLIPYIRECAPRYIFTLLEEDYHPDHRAVSQMTRAACFRAGLKKYSGNNTEWHYKGILYFGADNRSNKRRPDLYIDISSVAEIKKAACEAHRSQNVTAFAMDMAKQYGRAAGVSYAEGLYLEESLPLSSVRALFA